MIGGAATMFPLPESAPRTSGNPARALAVASEQRAFAELFESDLAFSHGNNNLATSGAGLQVRPSESARAVGSAATYQDPLPAGTTARSCAVAGKRAELPDALLDDAGGTARTPLAAARTSAVGATDVDCESEAVVKSGLLPSRASWSRTAMAACVRGSEVHLCIRTSEGSGKEEWFDQVRELIRGLGLKLASLRVNGVVSDR